MKRCLMLIAVVMICLTACDKPDVTEPDDKQEQTGNNGNENEGGNEDGTGNENGETPSEGEGEGETEKVKSMTITLEKLTATKAYFKASTKKTAPDIEIGIYYSQYAGDHIYDCERVWDYDLENGECELVIKDLDANTTYYYRPYLFMNGTRELGDELSFTTTDYSITVDVTVNGDAVTFSGYADIYIYSNGGIIYSTESQLSMSNYIGEIEPIKRGEYSYTLTDFSDNTTYYYRTYYWAPDGLVYGDVKSFTTGKNLYLQENKNLSLSSAIDLSSSGTANCYIVSKAGLYKIKAVKGNDESQVIANASTSAILWETFGTDIKPDKLDLIKEFCYKDGYIVFRIDDNFRVGNALIAVQDAEENILWSWHIWLTSQPKEDVYISYKDECDISYKDECTMMNRNLGATSSRPGDVEALGLLYQWGRKDPFLGSSSIRRSDEAKSTITWPSSVGSNASVGTIEYATANPTTYITADSDGDWQYNHDNTLWQSEKTIYDPCPAGWRIPDWSIVTFGYDDNGYDYDNEGISVTIKSSSTAWYPASGGRYGNGGWLFSCGDEGYYWSVNSKYYMWFKHNYAAAYVYLPAFGEGSASGFSIRCLKE